MTDKDKYKIDDLFEDAFHNFEDAPSNRVWENVQTNLAQKQALRYKRKARIFQALTFILAATLISIGIVYETANHTGNTIAVNNITAPAKNISSKNNFIPKMAAETSTPVLAEKETAAPVKENATAYNTAPEQIVPVKEKSIAPEQPVHTSTAPLHFKDAGSSLIKNNSTPAIAIPKTVAAISSSPAVNEKNVPDLASAQNIQQALENNEQQNEKSDLLEDIAPATSIVENITAPAEKNKEVSAKTDSALVTELPAEATTVSEPVKRKFFSRFYAQGLTGFALNQKILRDNPAHAEAPYNAAYFRNMEKENITFSNTFKIGFDISKRWSIQAGCTYFRLEQQTKSSQSTIVKGKSNDPDDDDDNDEGCTFHTSYGEIYVKYKEIEHEDGSKKSDTLILSSSSRAQMAYISVPITARYMFISKEKLSAYAISGITLDFLTGQHLSMDFSSNGSTTTVEQNSINGLRKMNSAFIAGLGLQYNIYKGLSLNFEPSLRMSYLSINEKLPVNVYPYSFSIVGGLSYHF